MNIIKREAPEVMDARHRHRPGGSDRRTERVNTAFTPADYRRVRLYAEQQEHSVSWVLSRAIICEIDAAGIEDDGVR